MSQAGLAVIEDANIPGDVATSYVTNSGGPAVPVGHVLNVYGATVAAGTNPFRSVGAGNTVTYQAQISQAIAGTDATKIGLAAFNSADFTVDANGFVSFSGGGAGITLTGNSGGALSPTAGNWNIFGASTAPGTSPVTTSGAVSTLTVNVQKSQAIASTDATKVGLAVFDSADFTVDANGFVSANTTGFIKTITGTSGGAIPPTASNINLLAATVASGTTPAAFAGAASTLTLNLQKSQALAVADDTKIGLSNFNSAQFSVDSNGFVSTSGTGVGNTITGNSGGALSPTGGNWNILGASIAAGTSPVSTSGSASTLTVNVQKSQAIASTDATKVGLAAFDSTSFAVDANGFVTLSGEGLKWNDVSGAFSPIKNNGYFVTGTATGTLPASPSQGDRIEFFVDTTQLLTIQAAGTQIIRLGQIVSSAGGTMTNSLQGDSVVLNYRAADTCWCQIGGHEGVWQSA